MIMKIEINEETLKILEEARKPRLNEEELKIIKEESGAVLDNGGF